MRALIALALAGLVAAVAYPLLTRRAAAAGERAAVQWLRAVADAQARFRAANGGYAATLQSLREPCAGQPPALTTVFDAGERYQVVMRGTHGAAAGPADCHGRTTVADFYAAARPLVVEPQASRGLALTSAGTIFVFFDGVPPLEADMAAGGLALPLE